MTRSDSLLRFFFCIFLILLLFLPHGTLGSSRSKAFADNVINSRREAPPPPGGLCSIAVTPHGYKCQEFQVVTGDGYVLSVVRIPEGRAGYKGPNNKPPVLLQHGVLVDGATWLLNSPDESLAMILADSGFDVWISNTRGTRFSRKHVSLDPNDPDFWEWSWDELVKHELPSVVDLVFRHTSQKIHYVGHSLGTLIALASLSEGNIDKLRSAALLSPIAYLSHMNTALGYIAAKAFVGEITTLFGVAEFNPKGSGLL